MLKHLQVGGLGLGNPTKIPLIKIKTAYDFEVQLNYPPTKSNMSHTSVWPEIFGLMMRIFSFGGIYSEQLVGESLLPAEISHERKGQEL